MSDHVKTLERLAERVEEFAPTPLAAAVEQEVAIAIRAVLEENARLRAGMVESVVRVHADDLTYLRKAEEELKECERQRAILQQANITLAGKPSVLRTGVEAVLKLCSDAEARHSGQVSLYEIRKAFRDEAE